VYHVVPAATSIRSLAGPSTLEAEALIVSDQVLRGRVNVDPLMSRLGDLHPGTTARPDQPSPSSSLVGGKT
jgi:hypothetical protein